MVERGNIMDKCIFKKKRAVKEKDPPEIDTIITVKTEKLYKKMKVYERKKTAAWGLPITTACISGFTVIKSIQMNTNGNPLSFWKSFSTLDIVLAALSIATIIFVCVLIYYNVKLPTTNKFISNFINELYDDEEFTAVFIIKLKVGNHFKILVTEKHTWKGAYLLPYCHFSTEEDSDKSEGKNDFLKILKQRLSETLGVSPNDFELTNPFEKNRYISIKPNPSKNGTVVRINYAFYAVQFKNRYIENSFRSSFYEWKSYHDLAVDPETQLHNDDILAIIKDNSLLSFAPNAFSDFPNTIKSKRVIWNITNECFYNCPICATNSGADKECEIPFEEKKKILFSLATINGYIDKLDISGGDPLKNLQDQNLIKLAKKVLPFTKISVTTTGKGLNNLKVSDVAEVLDSCDITYDIPLSWYDKKYDDFKKCREKNYNKENFETIEKIRNAGVNFELNIHVPIHFETIDEHIVEILLADISKIKPDNIKFIRIMPVGKKQKATLPSEYKPSDFLNIVKKCVQKNKYNFNISLNCSLRVKDSNEYHTCAMLKEKLGIDHLGNVYACIWAAYLPGFESNQKLNPFYLGNLREENMYQILDSERVRNFNYGDEKNYKYCRVCSYVKNENNLLSPDDGLESFEFRLEDEEN